MFNNPGSKIQELAKVLFVIEAIISVVFSFSYMFGEFDFLSGIFILIGSLAAAYVSSLFLIAFGELVENSSEILHKPHNNSDSSSAASGESISSLTVNEEKPYSGVNDNGISNDIPREEKLYLFALRNIEAGDRAHLISAVKDLELISGYKDADELLKQCREKLSENKE